MSDPIPLPPTANNPAPRRLAWLVGVIVGTALAAILAVQLPDRAKLLGLFPLIWGGLLGMGYAWWAGECRLKLSRWVYCVALLLLAIGEAGIVYQAWQFYQLDLRQQFSRDPAAGLVKQAEQSPIANGKPEEIELRKQLLAEFERVRQRRREALGLSTFLQRRLRKLGDIPQPWPELFYAGEILLGSLVGLAVMRFCGTRMSAVANSEGRMPDSESQATDASQAT
ncbi:MAG: Tryptophanyl-tRNA synthetase [Planctomycetaceae bacterium]|nr:Tryptophanyl-tRNA synthetase [Planctomycetaceae bacterium]